MSDTISILGSGWLGLPLAKMFKSCGYVVKLSTTSVSKLDTIKNQKLNPFLISIDRNSDSVQYFLRSKYLIINIPSKSSEGFKSFISQIETSEVKHVIYISSTSVYNTSNELITESDIFVDHNNPFYIIEQLFRNNRSFETTIIRFAGLIGKNRHPGNFFNSGKPIKNPDAPVNLIHQADCIKIIQEIIKQKVWNETFNACTDTHPSKRAFYSFTSKSIGNNIPTFNDSSDSTFKQISSERLKKHLNYQFIYSDLMKIPFENIDVD